MQNNKKQFGQFFTKKSDYILQGFEKFIKNKNVIDPFAGNGDLLAWAEKNNCKTVKGFDSDEKLTKNRIFLRDSINNLISGEFVCTNPPYLHKNKADKETKLKFFSNENSRYEDLYQVSIKSLMGFDEGNCIVPLNFLCAENSKKIRELFFNKFEIIKLNIFLEQVFEDTTYNVISFYFKKRKQESNINRIKATLYPNRKEIDIVLYKNSGWKIGGEFTSIISKTKNNLKIRRLVENDLLENKREENAVVAIQNIKNKKQEKISRNTKKIINNNIIILRAIDSKNGKKIQLEDIRDYGIDALVGKNTSRNSAHLIFEKSLTIEEQEILMNKFNNILNQKREEYFSFFLTNFRDNNRKRISFDFVYKFINYIYEHEKQPVLF